ncbi:MAG: DUF4105 domain-containing protein [Burkholderiales bacterium]
MAIAILVIAVGLWRTLQTPSQNRVWAADQARLPQVAIDGTRVTIENLRDFPADVPASNTVAHYKSATYDVDALESVWFVLVPFSTAWRGPAHSFVSFGFKDGRYLAISIEARREEGESYGLVAGLLRRFELIYVLGEERDLIGRRAAQSDHPLYLYRIKTTPQALRAAFLGIVKRADGLRVQPEFYDTVFNNCTSNLIDQLNAIAPGAVGWNWRRVLPGYADNLALELGIIDTPLTLDQARQSFRVDDRVRQFLHAPDFSARIRTPA